MIHRQRTVINGESKLQVTFNIPPGLWADSIHLVGDFNEWDQCSHPFRMNRQGQWQISVDLTLDRVYRFRYLIDGHAWTSEFPADGYATGSDGIDSFLISTTSNAMVTLVKEPGLATS